MKKHIFLYACLLVLGCLINSSAFGQEATKASKWSLQLNLQHQDITALEEISIGQLGIVDKVKIRPYYSLDIVRAFYKKPTNKFLMLVQVGYFANLYHEHWLSYEFGIGYERQIFKGLFASIRLKLGKARLEDHDQLYGYENGEWVVIENETPTSTYNMTSGRIDLGYRILNGVRSLDLILNTQFTVLNHGEFGQLPYAAFGVGLRYGL